MAKAGPGRYLYLVTAIVIGFLLGYAASCTVMPLEYYDINPASLHSDLKLDYFVLIADSFAANNDIGRSAARVRELVGDVDINELRTIQVQIEYDARYAGSAESVRSLINHLDLYLQKVDGGSPAQIVPEPTVPADSEHDALMDDVVPPTAVPAPETQPL